MTDLRSNTDELFNRHNPSRHAVLLALVAVLAFLPSALAAGGEAPRRHMGSRPQQDRAPRLVILYATCTVNANYLSPYNPEVNYTPNLSRFAESSILFEKHHTEGGQSGPTFASIFSGTQADEHHVFRHPVPLSEDLYLISEAYADNGYDTYFWNHHKMASAKLHYGQGIPQQHVFETSLVPNDRRFLEILERLASDKSYKAFVITNFTVTHSAYKDDRVGEFLRQYPEQRVGLTNREIKRFTTLYYKNRFGLQWAYPQKVQALGLTGNDEKKLVDTVELLYKSRIHYLDTLFGRLVAYVSWYGLLDESLIAFTADHGETLNRKDCPFKWTHGLSLMPEIVRVPFIVRAPSFSRGGRRYAKVTRSIDVFPTLAAMSRIGLKGSSRPAGRDLTAMLSGQEPAVDLPAYSHGVVATVSAEKREKWYEHRRYFPGEGPERMWVSLREGDLYARWRTFADGHWGFEVFDLAADPHGTKNIYDVAQRSHRLMAEKLEAYKAKLVETWNGMKAHPPRQQRGPGEKGRRHRPRRGEREPREPGHISPEDLESLRSLGYVE